MSTTVDELNFKEEDLFFFNKQGGGVIKKNFEKRNLPCHLFEERDGVYQFIIDFISSHPDIHKIAFSDGVTLYQLDLFDFIKKISSDTFSDQITDINFPLERGKTGHYSIFGDQPMGRMNLPYDEWKAKNDAWYERCRESLTADLLIISANAITLDGEIVSIDGLGNRVSGMIFGPRHVLCIVGKNKITTNIETALNKIHNEVVPQVYIRHMMKHAASFQDVPCVKFGRCAKCFHEYSACRNEVIIRGQIKPHADRIHLLLINENLGF